MQEPLLARVSAGETLHLTDALYRLDRGGRGGLDIVHVYGNPAAVPKNRSVAGSTAGRRAAELGVAPR